MEKQYLEQYHRMMRFYNRMKERCEKQYTISNVFNQISTEKDILNLIQNHIDANDITEEDYDMIYAFFQNCFHLKDWIKADKPYLCHKVEAIFDRDNPDNNVLCMKICADLL